MSRDSKPRSRVLLVDGSRPLRELAGHALSEAARLECVDGGGEALASLSREPADLVLGDLELPDMSGLELLERVRRDHPGTAFVVLTADATVDAAIGALRMGAADYLRKPIRPEALALTVTRVLAQEQLARENRRLRDALRTTEACRTLLPCVDPGEVHAASLDLLLRGTSHRRGLAIFRRETPPGAVGIVLRGFADADAGALRRLLVEKQRGFQRDAPERVALLPFLPFEAVLREIGVRGGAVLAVPMADDESDGGMAWVFEDDQPFDDTDLESATLIASHSTLALRNAARYHRAKERAFVDDVTEIYNARYLLQAARNEIQRAERYSTQLSVLFLDLDRFKHVNDRYGHLVGSRVLRRLAEVLSECVRQVDTLGRYGGDEFTVVCVDTDLATGLQVAERIRRTVAETIFEGEGGEPIRLTISIVVATYPQHSRDRDGLLDMADKAMYRAKSLGRDCVCSASELG